MLSYVLVLRRARRFSTTPTRNESSSMPFPIKPGKVTCVGLVAIMMVLPSSIWKSDSARASDLDEPLGVRARLRVARSLR